MPPTVSIIMPARNTVEYLNRCIDSVISQHYRDWELLIINDGSTDNTRENAVDFSNADPRIFVYDSKGTGVSAARNMGLDMACGKYISFIDSDDRIDPEYLSELTEMCERENADISQCSFYYSYPDGRKESNDEAATGVFEGHKEIMNAYFSGMIGKVNLACWGKLYRSDLIKDIRFDENLVIQEDAYFTFQSCMKAKKAVCSSNPRYYYCQNPKSAMNRPFDGNKMQYFTVLAKELDVCRENGSLCGIIRLRKLITALDLTSRIVRDNSGSEYLVKLRETAIETYDDIKKTERMGTKTRVKMFILNHFPSMYYGLLKI